MKCIMLEGELPYFQAERSCVCWGGVLYLRGGVSYIQRGCDTCHSQICYVVGHFEAVRHGLEILLLDINTADKIHTWSKTATVQKAEGVNDIATSPPQTQQPC